MHLSSSKPKASTTRAGLARAHGTFNVIGGLWPIVHRHRFEAVTGPKVDYWLVRTVAGLMVTNGATQLLARSTQELGMARRIGVGTALTLGLIDSIYAPRGRISRFYLLDGAAAAGWIVAWLRS